MLNDLQEILTQAVVAVKSQYGWVVLTKIAELTPFTVRQLQRLRENDFVIVPTGKLGKHREKTKLSGFEEAVNDFLRKGISTLQVIFDSIKELGYKGGLTTVKNYIGSHQDLVPAQRILTVATPNRGRRYEPVLERCSRWTGASFGSRMISAEICNAPASPWSATTAGSDT